MNAATSEKTTPKISVVIPLYNKVSHIGRAVDSVLKQTEQDFEIVVVNDASTDGGEEKVRQFADPRIRLFQREKPGPGGHAARNLGIRESKADLVAFLDADDAYCPIFLETILRLKNRFPEAGAYCTEYEIFGSNGRRKPRLRAIPPFPWEGIIPSYFESSLGEPPVWTSATAVPKKIFSIVGFFPEGVRLGGDLDMWLRIALSYPIAMSRVVGALYFRDAENRVCDKEYSDEGLFLIKVAQEAIQDKKLSSRDRFFLTEYVHMKTLESAGRCIVSGDPGKARSMLLKCNTRLFLMKKIFFVTASFFPQWIVLFFRSIKKRQGMGSP